MTQTNLAQTNSKAPAETDMAALKATAAALLLRSEHLSLSQILDLLDIGDAEFRDITDANPQIAELLEQRRNGTLESNKEDLKSCSGCGEWFLPYAGARYCSDECKRIAKITGPVVKA